MLMRLINVLYKKYVHYALVYVCTHDKYTRRIIFAQSSFCVHDVCKSFTISTIHLYNEIAYTYTRHILRYKFLIIFVECQITIIMLV